MVMLSLTTDDTTLSNLEQVCIMRIEITYKSFFLWSALVLISTLQISVSEKVFAGAPSETVEPVDFPKTIESLEKTIYVGVREEAIPFSYKKPSKAEEDILVGFGGYIVEVCRSILRQVITSGPFNGYHVKGVPVTANNRFEKLVSGEVDMLCGPDSITTARLHKFNVSHPIFLSGVAVAKLPIDRLPQGRHCGPVIGVVKGTTSQFAGLQAAVNTGVFERFNAPVREYLSIASRKDSEPDVSRLNTVWQDFVGQFVEPKGHAQYTVSGENAHNPPWEISTDNDCSIGYSAGPVIVYNNHDDGIRDLCDGNIFFYLGDVDIIKRKVPENCEISISRQTFTKEAYGIYFRKFKTVFSPWMPMADIHDAVLYSEFNNVLLTQMQDSENVLHNQYISEFGDSKMAIDLETFFESFQYATNY